jgi:hypothetical protein
VNGPRDSNSVGSNEKQQQIRRIVEGFLRRLDAGESVSDQSLISEHPNLMPELAEELRRARLVPACEKHEIS